MLISSSLTMGARAATPCGRSLSGGATPSTFEGWVCLSLRGKSPWLECTPAGQSAYCLVTMGVCPSPFPLNCYVSACSFESHAVWHLLALRRGVLSMPELLRRLALAVRGGALAHAVRCLSSGSSRQKMAFSPGCRSRVARTKEQRRRLLCTGVCLRCYSSRIGCERLHYDLAVVFILVILPVDRATCQIPRR